MFCVNSDMEPVGGAEQGAVRLWRRRVPQHGVCGGGPCVQSCCPVAGNRLRGQPDPTGEREYSVVGGLVLNKVCAKINNTNSQMLPSLFPVGETNDVFENSSQHCFAYIQLQCLVKTSCQ